VGRWEGMNMDIPLFISICIGNFFCYIMGTLAGRKSLGAKLFSRARAYIKIYKNGDIELHARQLGDDLKMFFTVCRHLEAEGYNMDAVEKSFTQAIIEGNEPDESEEEA
jgi:hypothetical protein